MRVGTLTLLAVGTLTVGGTGWPGAAAADTAAGTTTSVVAVGDIACQPNWPGYNDGEGTGKACRQKYTAETAQSLKPDKVFMLGDLQYQSGYRRDFSLVFDMTWGQPFLDRDTPADNHMWPVPGNHEYRDPDAAGYFSYFNGGTTARPARTGVAGHTGDGWYREELPGWTVLALNADCTYLKGGCGKDSEQYTWLRKQLRNTKQCTVAFWHQPLFNKGKEPAAHGTRAFWKLLHQAHADLILNGHDHTYQRFPRLGPDGKPDRDGLQQITIGTGGIDLTHFKRKPSQPSVVTKSRTTMGVLDLKLAAGSWSWRFVPADFPGNGDYTDKGSMTCV